MKRRQFICFVAGAAAWPLGARAQRSVKTPRVAVLSTANPRSSSFFQAFEQRLRDLGYVEGQNIAFEYRNAGGEIDKLPSIAAELINLDVDVIVTSTDVATRAAKDATSQIPILMVAINYDPIALGYVETIARPGANVTGLYFQHLELLAKRLGLLKEMLPGVKRVAVLYDGLAADQLKQVSTSNRSVSF